MKQFKIKLTLPAFMELMISSYRLYMYLSAKYKMIKPMFLTEFIYCNLDKNYTINYSR